MFQLSFIHYTQIFLAPLCVAAVSDQRSFRCISINTHTLSLKELLGLWGVNAEMLSKSPTDSLQNEHTVDLNRQQDVLTCKSDTFRGKSYLSLSQLRFTSLFRLYLFVYSVMYMLLQTQVCTLNDSKRTGQPPMSAYPHQPPQKRCMHDS